MMKLFRLQNLRWGKYLAAALFIGLGGTYGYWVEALDTDIEWLWAITMVVSVMHFWYDGFVWSVRQASGIERPIPPHTVKYASRSDSVLSLV